MTYPLSKLPKNFIFPRQRPSLFCQEMVSYGPSRVHLQIPTTKRHSSSTGYESFDSESPCSYANLREISADWLTMSSWNAWLDWPTWTRIFSNWEFCLVAREMKRFMRLKCPEALTDPDGFAWRPALLMKCLVFGFSSQEQHLTHHRWPIRCPGYEFKTVYSLSAPNMIPKHLQKQY